MFSLLLLLLAASVKDTATLRAGCSADDGVVATLQPGEPLTIRFRMEGDAGPCYKVAARADGKSVEGFLSGSAIAGVDDFEKSVRDAPWLEVTQAIARQATRMPSLTPGAGTGVAAEAVRLIEASRPRKALELIQPELVKKRDHALLALAGMAEWRADDSRKALDYWEQALALQPDPELERLYKRVEREVKGDQSADRLLGMQVLLRYDSATVPADTARQMLGVLDQEYARISAELGCHADERTVAIVQSQDAYRKTVDVAEWNGGQFDGRIRVPVAPGQGMDAATERIFAHETVHACLAMIGQWPVWLHEGLAQKLSGDKLTAAAKQKLAEMAEKKKLPRLENLGQDWSRLDAEHAVLAYALALAGVETYYENFPDGIGNLLRNPDKLASVTADLDRRLGL